MDPIQASAFLSSLLDKILRIHTTDTRMFVGNFKCTDNEQNIILSSTYEYRWPSSTLQALAQSSNERSVSEGSQEPATTTKKLDMTSRFLGLVVVPGQHITKIEVEGE